ncbi:hypothetical protein Q4E40_07245 [Pontibacter sp. BT731]|uniref:hypothetical protein n=1 Tax=Pontibacter coccineus TaxID=3063328 RepID=UPI0026E2395B|nr:hypothetical protein [Pontibacter sp. BT731]MDO6389917.1 hypothetical protein [Pontibacter sp. BT731]
MNDQEAQIIGSRLAMKSVLFGAIVAYLVMTFMTWSWDNIIEALTWIKHIGYVKNLLVGLLGLLVFGYIFGKKAGHEIIIQKKDHTWVGFKYGFLTLWAGTFVGCLVGFFEEGLDNIGTGDNPFEDYFFKPFFWITIFGLVPVVLVGFWFGSQIKKKGRRESSANHA